MTPPLQSWTQRVASRLWRNLNREVLQGSLQTATQMAERLAEYLERSLSARMGPSLKLPRIGRRGRLLRSSLDDALETAYQDNQTLNEGLLSLQQRTRETVNVCLSDRAGLARQLMTAVAETDRLRMLTDNTVDRFVWVVETLSSADQLDPGSIVHHDQKAGIVTLPVVGSVDLTSEIVEASVDMELSRGGLPGNNLEILAPGREALSGTPPAPHPIQYRSTFRTDAISALWDGRPDTAFEWERVYVRSPQNVIRAGRAFVYDPAGRPFRGIPRMPNWNCFVYWPGQQELDTGFRRQGYPLAYFDAKDVRPLELSVTIKLSRPLPISWIKLIPAIRQSTYPEVQQILLSPDGDNWKRVLSQPTYLHPRMNHGIDLERQGFSVGNYEGIGAWSLPGQPVQHIRLMLRQPHSYECRLGVAHPFRALRGGKRGRVGTAVVGSPASLPGDSIEAPPVDSSRTYDVFSARRQVIGIRDVSLEIRTYQEAGLMLSRTFSLARPVRSVGLLANVTIPEGWPEGDWVSWEVSPNGDEWFPLQTLREEQPVVFRESTTTLQVRATLSRPEGLDQETPTIHWWALKGIPA